MSKRKYLLGEYLSNEEGYKIEFKEVKGNNPINAIKNTCDEYVVAFLNYKGGSIIWGVTDKDKKVVGIKLSDANERDDLRKAIDNKLGQITPNISPSAYKIIFHNVFENEYEKEGLYIVEIKINAVKDRDILYATSGKEVFLKTISGKRKLSHEQVIDEIQRRNNNAKRKSPKKKESFRSQPPHVFIIKFNDNGEPDHEDKELWALGVEAYHFSKYNRSFSFQVVLKELETLQSELIQYEKKDLSNDERISKIFLLEEIERLKSKKKDLDRALELLFHRVTRTYVSDPYEIGLVIKGLGKKSLGKFEIPANHQSLDIWRRDHKKIGTVFQVKREELDSEIYQLLWGGEADVYDLGQKNMMNCAIPAVLLELVEIESNKIKIDLSDLLIFSKWSIGIH